MCINDWFAILVLNDGVADDAVVAGWHHHCGLGSKHYLLMVLSSECLRTNFHAGDIGVVIQHVDEKVRLDANNYDMNELMQQRVSDR